MCGYPTSIIAGGAVRDTYFNLPISDIDIYIEDPYCNPNAKHDWIKPPDNIDKEYIGKLMGVSNIQSFWNVDSVSADGRIEYLNSHVIRCWDVRKDAIDYQLMFVDTSPVEYVNRFFDIGICKAYCDGIKMRYTRDFVRDATNKTLTICGEEMSDDQFNYMLNHHLKTIKKKFPGFSTVVSSHNQCFVDDNNIHML